uniref:Putative secreted protein n=1 Tax=Ixodes ricinus TaxID=34613 RepID=A0A6B0ULP9_IXORI
MPPTSLVLVALGQHSVTSSGWRDKCRQPVWSASLSASCVGAVAMSERRAPVRSDCTNRGYCLEVYPLSFQLEPIGVWRSDVTAALRRARSRRTCAPHNLLQHTISSGSNGATGYRY